MKRTTTFLSAALVAAVAAVRAEDVCPVSENVRGHENIEWQVSYAYGLTDATKGLPRVLLVGDSICNGYQDGVRRRLAGKVNVTYWASSYCVTSPGYLRLLGFYLDEAKYDVVHFNNGLHSAETPVDAYEKGLRAALALIREKQPKAKLVWCTSTPVNDAKIAPKVKALNAAAARAVADFPGVVVDDLFALMDPLDRKTWWRDTHHFSPAGIARQADQVADCVRRALGTSAPCKEALVFLSAHPDDTDGFAATVCLLRDRYDIHVVDLTHGELGLGYPGLRDGSTGWRRTQEETKAQAYLGTKLHFLYEIDGSAAAGRTAADDLAKLLLQIRPRAVFTHWPVDNHADHAQCSALLVNALRLSGLNPERYFFEEWMSQTRNMVPTYYVDVTKVFAQKLKALSFYECQNVDDSLLKMTAKRAKWRGRQRVPAVEYAEPFTTWDGRPVRDGVFATLGEAAVAPGAEKIDVSTEEDVP